MHTQLPFFAVIQIKGDDRHDFLHNQLSNDINHLPKNHACYATYNTPKGRVIANMIVYNIGDELLMILAADLAEKVLKRLRMYVLRAKVQLAILDDWGVAARLNDDAQPIAPTEPHLLLTPNKQGEIVLPHTGCLTIAPKNTLPSHDVVAELAWQTHEINSAYPWISATTSETCVAQMLNQHIIGGVHFRKGCYPGQEVIARAQYRGQVKRGLAVAHNTVAHNTVAQQAGNAVQDDSGAEAGIVINCAGDLNLLVIKHAVAAQALRDEQGNAFVLDKLFFETQGS